MSTRAAIIFKDGKETMNFYRHSDGYPDTTGADLKAFCEDYTNGNLRNNIDQSAGWLVVRGHFEYKREDKIKFEETDLSGPRPDARDKYNVWKVGAYEPTKSIHGDEEYIYIIDLQKFTLECRQPISGFWDKPSLKLTAPCKEFKTVNFDPANAELTQPTNVLSIKGAKNV